MNTTSTTIAPTAPYPGLRPFSLADEKLYFGRAEQITSMLACLEEHRFLAVVGGSGSGKSSLVQAGLLPALRQGYLLGAGTEWTFITMKPGGDPVNNLATSFLRSTGHGTEPDLSDSIICQAALQTSPLALLELVEQADMADGAPLLLLVDQFEEIFRFRQRAAAGPVNGGSQRPLHQERNEATAFVNLLLATVAAATERELPIYIVITMRSEFIGDCEAFIGLSQAVSTSQFLVPRMSRDQIKDVIEKPLLLFDAHAEPALVNLIINEAGSFSDQLPLMQHALMRTWNQAKARQRDQKEPLILTVDDYQRVGRVSHALSQHLEAVWDTLANDFQKRIARILFLSLSDQRGDGILIRRMVELGSVAQVADTDATEVSKVVQLFQENECHFIVASPPGELGEHTVLDISHEALLRQWDLLRSWLSEEAQSVQTYCRLADAARLHAAGETSLWRDPELQRALQWRERNQPNEAWATRYHVGFADAMAFLNQSQAAAQKEREAQQRSEELDHLRKTTEERNRRLRKGLLLISSFSVLSFILGGVSFPILLQRVNRAQSHALAASARALLDTDPQGAQEAGLMALSGLHGDPGDRMAVSDTLGLAVLKNKQIGSIATQQGIVYSLLELKDGDLISAGGDGTLSRWHWHDGNPSEVVASKQSLGKQGAVLTMIQVDEDYLLSGDVNGNLQRWSLRRWTARNGRFETAPRKIGAPIHTGQGTVTSLVQLRNGEVVSGGVNGSLQRWRIHDGIPRTLGGLMSTTQGTVIRLAQLPSGELVSVGADGSLRYWLNGKSMGGKTTLPNSSVTSLVVRSNGDVISGAGDGSLRRWVNRRPVGEAIPSGQGAVRRLVELRSGELISVGADASLRLWRDLKPDGLPITTGQTTVTDLLQLRNGELISGGADGLLRRWRLSPAMVVGTRIASEQGQVRSLVELRVPATGVVISGGGDGSLRVWSNGWPLTEKISTGQGTVTSLLELRSGEVISGGEKGSLRRWRWREGKISPSGAQVAAHPAPVLSLIQLANGDLVSGGADGSLRFWRDGTPIGGPVATGQGAVLSLIQLGTGDMISGGADGDLRRWRNGKPIGKPIPTGQDTVISLLKLTDDAFISGGGDGSLQRWHVRGGVPLKDGSPIPTRQGWVRSLVKLASDEVISGGFDGSLLRWRDGKPMGDGKPISTQQGQVISLLVLQNDAGLISGGEDGSLWWVRPGEFIRKACFSINRSLAGEATGVCRSQDQASQR